MFRIFVRYCTQGPTKADTKISWNRDNKQLFGGVIKVKKARKAKAKCDPDAKVKALEISPKLLENPSKSVEPILSSEMHWMLGPAHNRRRMFAKPYDNTERVALKIKHPVVEEQERRKRTTNGFDAILRVPLLMMSDEECQSQLQAIPELEYHEMPSVGKILQATMSDGAREALIQWKLSKVAELGEEGFQLLQKENLGRGLRFHNLLQDHFTSSSDTDHSMAQEDPNYLVWQSVQSVLPEIEKPALFVEQRVCHPVLQYKGVVDCVSTIGNNIYGIEWKNSEKTKSTIAATYDAPLQLCAYVGALNATQQQQQHMQISSGMVVVAYQSGSPADYYKLDRAQLHKYWYAWLLRVQEYFIRRRDGTLPEPIF